MNFVRILSSALENQDFPVPNYIAPFKMEDSASRSTKLEHRDHVLHYMIRSEKFMKDVKLAKLRDDLLYYDK